MTYTEEIDRKYFVVNKNNGRTYSMSYTLLDAIKDLKKVGKSDYKIVVEVLTRRDVHIP